MLINKALNGVELQSRRSIDAGPADQWKSRWRCSQDERRTGSCERDATQAELRTSPAEDELGPSRGRVQLRTSQGRAGAEPGPSPAEDGPGTS